MNLPRIGWLLLSIALCAVPSPAAAEEYGPEPPAPSPYPPSPYPSSPYPPSRYALGFNPLAVALGRFGGDFEYLVRPHNVLVVNVHGDYASHVWPALEYDRISPVWGFGGEVGWRFFTQNPRMHGFFLGPSIIGGYYNADYRGRRIDLPGAGVAVDLGWQWELGPSLFLGFGFGLQHLWTARYPADIAPGVSFVMGAGFDPRLLFTIGGRWN